MALERVEAVDLPGVWEENTKFGEESANLQNHPRVSFLQEETTTNAPLTQPNAGFRVASGRSLLRHAGTWEGGDLEECLLTVYATRGQAEP